MFKPTILIDFEETITDGSGFNSSPNLEAIKSINKLKDYFKIVIFSCRANKNVCPMIEEVLLLEYLKKYNIFYDEISTRKPIFYVLIDDQSLNPRMVTWDFIVEKLLSEVT